MPIEPRPVKPADAEAVAALLARVAGHHPTGFEPSAGEVVDRIERNPTMALEGAWDGDDLVAFTTVTPRAAVDGTHPVRLMGDVDPSRLGEGIGTFMLGRAMATARAIHRHDHPEARLRLSTGVPGGRDEQAALLRAHGFTCRRHSFLMVSPLAARPVPPVPAGLVLSTVDPAISEELRQAHNAAFADYPDHVALDATAWESFVMSPACARHDHSFVLREPAEDQAKGGDDDGAIVAYLLTQEDETAVSGAPGREAHIAFVATLPSHRGRGLASWLLAHALADFRDAGYETSALDVDTENPTGALGVYERAGYVVHQRDDTYVLVE